MLPWQPETANQISVIYRDGNKAASPTDRSAEHDAWRSKIDFQNLQNQNFRRQQCFFVLVLEDRKLWILYYNDPAPPAVHTSVRAGDLPTTLVPFSRPPLSCPVPRLSARCKNSNRARRLLRTEGKKQTGVLSQPVNSLEALVACVCGGLSFSGVSRLWFGAELLTIQLL